MKKYLLFSILTAAALANTDPSEACTGLRLKTEDGHAVHGRTFEFGIKVETTAVVIPRGHSFMSTTPRGSGLTYRSKYSAVGAMCFDNVAILDGMNEEGLSVGTFYFPGFAQYTPTTAENQSLSLSPVEFSNWLLTQFETIEEIKSHLSLGHIFIAPTIIPQWGPTPAPFHYIVYDKNGKSIVIEPINGKLVISDNPLGVLTNSPTFDWHMTNLRNFIDLSPKNVNPVKVDSLTLTPFGQGSGMVGLPGDFTPPSRFLRAAIFSTTSVQPKNSDDGVFKLFHLLNQFDIPMGVSREETKGAEYYDYTLATVVHDPSKLRYYFRTYEDQTIRMIDLNQFKADTAIKAARMTGRQNYVDVSSELKPISLLPKP